MNIIERILPNDDAADDLAAKLNLDSVHTVRGWRRRKSIPKWHWSAIVTAKIATYEQLAAAVAANQPQTTNTRAVNQVANQKEGAV